MIEDSLLYNLLITYLGGCLKTSTLKSVIWIYIHFGYCMPILLPCTGTEKCYKVLQDTAAFREKKSCLAQPNDSNVKS